jgi:two-component system cell cycle sensor histidine kinase/response regulator CckA
MVEKLTYEELEHQNNRLKVQLAEQRKADKKIESQNRLMNTLLDNLQLGVFMIEAPSGRPLLANSRARILLGRGIIPDSDKTNLADTYKAYKVGTGKIYPENELPIVCGLYGKSHSIDDMVVVQPDGKKVFLEVFGSPVFDKSGKITASIISFADITQRRGIEKEQERLKSQLRQAQKMESIGTLAGGIAHDFNNILSGIFGYSQLAQTHLKNPEKASQDIEQILQGAKRAADLVQQILTFSRQTEYQKRPLKIYTAVYEALKLLRASIPSTIEIEKKLDSKSVVFADPIRIHQVVMNLCTNSYHAMREHGGSLTVSLTDVDIFESKYLLDKKISPGEYIKLEISDTGIGMDENELNKAFEPYFTTKGIGQGTGLGLALVHAIVDEHDCFLDIKSKPGKGTSFYIYFPIFKPDIKSDGLKEPKEFQIKGNERIMVVDDEESIRHSCSEYLQSQGYKVDTFSNGVDALKKFKIDSKKFDLIITDLTMPELTGDKFAEEILKIQPKLPIILCTGYHDTFTETKAIALGIKKFVYKPILSQDLTILIREILD